jgi:phospholipid/cholesterol/gamma-HCH transport system substrate-binding protein
MELSRPQRVAAGAIGLVLFLALGYTLFQVANGAWREEYTVSVVLGELGQNLNTGNDVKIRGVRVGSVTGVEITDDLRAQVTMTMDPGYRVPEDSTFRVTGKTLLGEKQVEIHFDGPVEDGPYLAAGSVVTDPDRVVEFEDVLATFADLLEEVNPDELAVVVEEFIAAFEGMGPEVARSIDEGARAASSFRGMMDDQIANNRNLSLVADELGGRGQDFNRLGRAVEQGMPTISENHAEIRGLLDELAAFARVVDTTFRGTREDIDRMIVEGDPLLRLFYRYRVAFGDIFPTGLGEYSTAFLDGTGYEPEDRDEADGLAAYFQILIDESKELEELCNNLPPELASGVPGCGESTITEPRPPGGQASASDESDEREEQDLPDIDELDRLRDLPAPEVQVRRGADTLMRNALGGAADGLTGGER